MFGQATNGPEPIPPFPSRLVTDDDLKNFYEAMKISDVPKSVMPSGGVKRKGEYLGGLDTQQYGRGKRTREVCLLCFKLCMLYCIPCLLCVIMESISKSNELFLVSV